MNNKFIRNLNRIEFVVTNGCTGRCKHCSQGEHIFSGEHINGNTAAEAVAEICREFKIDSIMTFGGEPLLYPEDVCRIHLTAKQCGIENRELITNGYFSKSKERISEIAHLLSLSGITKILLSVDAFHQETIPIEPVLCFAECVKSEKVHIKVHPAWLGGRGNKNLYNNKTEELLQIFTKKGIEVSDGNVIIPSGNAKKYLKEYFNDETEYISPYLQNPFDINAISINPDGSVLGGNIYNNSITDILNAYYPE